MTRINFQPYSHTQLHQIITSRLKDVTGFDAEAVELCARKVGAVSGDARRALDICRMAVELAEMEVKEKGGRLEDARVTIGLIHKAVRDMFATPAVACVRDAALQEKMFLTAFLKSLRRTGTGESTLGEIMDQHALLCRIAGIPCPPKSSLEIVSYTLSSTGLIIIEANSTRGGGKGGRVRLGVGEEDVSMALRDDPLFRPLAP
ncbi:hypothetical protein BJ684DRAFT_19237 [Piptocephalis cylindrospora]|uniref:Origin recognition complex subunit 1 n=1 Tax=Piptocephalis cylindrospora TaxID=1907219 RepID=A0A4P9Y5N7_9FUNG|nr:hypothetical protein BJ684DRAFT_19237 [Piptocephalis cylindrospora]|eukprot:RKP14348.1 hypothetical protein BJ684DRAFT_19237 [Piptocephalis cylindrospora]